MRKKPIIRKINIDDDQFINNQSHDGVNKEQHAEPDKESARRSIMYKYILANREKNDMFVKKVSEITELLEKKPKDVVSYLIFFFYF
jgi:hypothetical protein